MVAVSLIYNSDKTKLNVYPRTGSAYSYPSVTLYADEDFFNLKYVAPIAPLVAPEFKGISEGSVLSTQKINYVMTVHNPSNYPKIFSGTIDTNMGSINPHPTFIMQSIPANSDGRMTFIYQSPSVSAQTDFTISGQICDSYSGQSKCTPFQVVRTIDKAADEETITCPDGTCDKPAEDYGTCPQDCEDDITPPPVDCSDIANSYVDNNECVCNDGYAREFDKDTGDMQCRQPEDYAWLAYGVLGVAILALGYAVFSKKRGRKR